jgi:hypothetical protein
MPGSGHNAATSSSVWYDYILPECVEVPVSEFPEIRTPRSSGQFSLDKLNIKLRLGDGNPAARKRSGSLR